MSGCASICAHRRVRSQCKDCKRRKACRRRLAAVIGCSMCMRAARHVALKCSRLMLGVHAHDPSRTSAPGSRGRHRRSPLRPRSTRTPAMPSDATGGWPCLHPPCVSSRAHHRARYSAHGHVQWRAYMRALAHVYMRNVAYAHSTSLTRSRADTLVRTCAHAHAHSQTDGFTHTDITGKRISQERHTQTHTCTHAHTYLHTAAYIQPDTHLHTHLHK